MPASNAKQTPTATMTSDDISPKLQQQRDLRLHKSDLVQLLDTATPALVSGAIQSVLFNPFDRALYVRVQSRRRRFLDRRNFVRPFQGFGNAAVYRTIVGASYVFWQDSCRIWIPRAVPSLAEDQNPTLNAVSVGLVAGAANGLALNNLQAIKFRMWTEAPPEYHASNRLTSASPPTASISSSSGASKGFFGTARHMYATGGIRVFYRGCIITMQRDSVFGVTYEGLRRAVWFRDAVRSAVRLVNAPGATLTALFAPSAKQSSNVDSTSVQDGPTTAVAALRQQQQKAAATERQAKTVTFLSNLLAAVLATMASSPWNYVRSVAYGCPAHAEGLHRAMVVRFLFLQTKYAFEHGETYRKIAYHSSECIPRGWHFHAAFKVLNRRLNVGWGSLRVGLGMAVGQHVFGLVQSAMTTVPQHSVPSR
jgi:hypothetical protein